ncbi:phage portal protein [Pseudaquabacterium pictum]|uniref:Portal protein n=1 Tax=Pseudaquabacterium pictum TaxID=2315236 RepID=A0A480AJ68_9BURK|nr:phage portal protein [Rubrivivax pictus]GCL61503.1 portal protein [Rubrivivax pictus]
MSAQLLDLNARRHEAGTLMSWLASRDGAAQRAGLISAPRAENATTTNLTANELSSVLGLVNLTASGVAVTPDTAMRVATVYACVSLLAGTISTLPFAVFERDGDTRKRAQHDYWWMLNEQAHDKATSASAWEALISGKLFYGDGFARLLRPGFASSRVIGWEPLHPMRVQPFEDTEGTVYYRYQPSKGPQLVLDAADVVHLPSLGFDGLNSPSPITYAAREAIGTSIAAEQYSARFFSQGATFDYALKTEGKLNKDQLDDLKDSLRARLQGNARGPLILTGGLQPAQLSVNSKDAEILATRLFSVEEICRIFGVPPHMVGHTDKSTSWGTGIEQQGIGFVRYTLQRHLTPLAQEFNRKLWPVRQRYFVEHITDALVRGDLKSRYESFRIALGRAGEPGWMTPNEVRRIDNQPPIDGGDTINLGGSDATPTA